MPPPFCLPRWHLSTKKTLNIAIYIYLLHTWTMHINMVILKDFFLGKRVGFLY
jgi:hypothetical protein